MKRFLTVLALIASMMVCSTGAIAAPAIPSILFPPMPSPSIRLTPIILHIPATPTWVDAVVLASNTAQSYTIPTGANYLIFSATALFYVSFTGTAATPTQAVTNGTAPLIAPVLVPCTGVTSISLIAPAATIVTIASFN